MSRESLAYLLLWLVPFFVLAFSLRKLPRHAGLLTGISLGTIVSPASLGLYSLYYSGNILGFLGLFLSFLHDSVTYAITTWAGIIPERTVVEGVYQLIFFTVSAIIWSIVYGTIGKVIDALRRSRKVVQIQTQ